MKSEPTNLYADTIEPVRRSRPDEIFFIRMEATPEPGSEDFGTLGGGVANCYVDADDLRAAELRAVALILRHDWRPQLFESWELTCAECANDQPSEEGGPSAREMVEEAVRDGESCVFFTWPIDAPDADDEVA